MKRFLCGLVAVGLLVAWTGRAKADYVFTTIDVITVVNGINDSGQIVGWYTSGGFYGGSFPPGPQAPAKPFHAGSTTLARSWESTWIGRGKRTASC